MAESKDTQSRKLPERIDVYVIGDDGSVSDGAGYDPVAYISEQDAGRIYEKDVALHILKTHGRIVGVMRDSTFRTTPKEYRTRKMILGKVELP